MKTNYAVTREGKILVESDDLDYIQRMKEEFSYRRTGRTTRMLFQALGDPAQHVVIIARNRYQVEFLMDTVCEILKSMRFEYELDYLYKTIDNFGKTYHFCTQDNYSKLKLPNHVKYLDEN